MMFSKACEYGLKALLHISRNSIGEKKTSLKEITDELNLPGSFLSKILQNLVRNKILESSKGPNGGFYIQNNKKSVPIIRVVEIIDGLDSFHKCGLGLKKCSDETPCPIHYQFKPYRDKLKQLFEEKTIADLTTSLMNGRAFLQNEKVF